MPVLWHYIKLDGVRQKLTLPFGTPSGKPEKRVNHHDQGVEMIFEAIRTLIATEEGPKRKIGFHNKL